MARLKALRKSPPLPLQKCRKFSLPSQISLSCADTVSDTYFDSSQGLAVTAITHELAADAVKDATASFHDALPQSLFTEKASHDQDCIAPFTWDECVRGPLLGSGEFGNVYELDSFRLDSHQSQTISASVDEWKMRLLMKNREKYRQTNKARYALKHIRPMHLGASGERLKYIQASSDLALEKEFLSSLEHPHIIKLRGVANSGPTGLALIIDHLVETLEQRMKRWRNPVPRLRRNMANLSSSLAAKVKPGPKLERGNKVLDQRLSIALQIAAAMEYLHSHKIVYRDLKPANIGFDVRGDVKIFDFGFARFCPEGGDPNKEMFDMSGAGTPRYLSPECLSGDAYNAKSDVYSYALVLWEMLSLKTSFAFAKDHDELFNYVVKEHRRPDIDQRWPGSIKSLLKLSFSEDASKRPEMQQVYNQIHEVLVFLRGGAHNDLSDKWLLRRRSVASVDG